MSHTVTFTYNGLYAYIETEVLLPATPEQAWQVLADFGSWGHWSSGFMTWIQPPKAPGQPCALVCQLRHGALKTSAHHPVVRAGKSNAVLACCTLCGG
jgi:hypothetical protein